jgi:diaminopimelate epimerase
MRLAKWQGLGNDYLVIEEWALPGPLSAEVIGLLCDRHLGVGADGILLRAQPTGAVPGAVARMRVFNPDGGEPEMCGNGIRIFARYLALCGAATELEFTVETLAGAIRPRLLEDGTVRVDMGRARFRSANIVPAPAAGLPGEGDVVDFPLTAAGRDYRFTFVDVGNPHCIILVDDPASLDVAAVGAVIERLPIFPNRVNVEFIRIEPDGSVHMRVWERGVGETQACGTGATAVGAACVRLGLAESPVLVHLLGGDLVIEVAAPGGDGGRTSADAASNRDGWRVFMTGPAEEVFFCTLSGELLNRLGWPATADCAPAGVPAAPDGPTPSAAGSWAAGN